MAMHGRGLICLALPDERAKQLNLELMAASNQSRHQTNFTVSIEAREGVSTGISAHDRSHTISVAIDPTKGAGDIATPGHVFPLVARDGGVLVRTGHTEAAVDIARLAGLYPAGVICEIMNDDGTMARLPDLVKFAQLHGLKVGTIADLISYRRQYDHFVQRVAQMPLESDYGGSFDLHVYRNALDGIEHIAIVKGDISGPEPVLVRMHSANLLADVLGAKGGSGDLLHKSMRLIGAEGRGVIVLIRETRLNAVSDLLSGKPRGSKPVESEPSKDATSAPPLRLYGVGAQILIDLGVHQMELLSNTTNKSAVGLEGYGLSIVGQRAIPLAD